MPTYDYLCASNGKVLEVKHSIGERIDSWGELCERLDIEPGDTPADAPVQKLITGGGIVKSSSLGSVPPCASGAPCCGPVCGAGGGCD
jgi:hypothetical protein